MKLTGTSCRVGFAADEPIYDLRTGELIAKGTWRHPDLKSPFAAFFEAKQDEVGRFRKLMLEVK